MLNGRIHAAIVASGGTIAAATVAAIGCSDDNDPTYFDLLQTYHILTCRHLIRLVSKPVYTVCTNRSNGPWALDAECARQRHIAGGLGR